LDLPVLREVAIMQLCAELLRSTRFARDSALEGAVHCELVSGK
jgi:hypothetical protein